MSALHRRGAGALVAAMALAGCHTAVKSDAPVVDADRASGADRQRSGAAPMAVNRPVTDDVDWSKGDATDWKMVTLDGNPGLLEVKLHWDNAAADLLIDVFNGSGEQIASSPGLQPGAVEKRITVEIPAPGPYFLRVSGHAKEDASAYTVVAQWAGAPTMPVAGVPAKEEKAEVAPDEPSDTHTGEEPPDDDDRGLQGRIVSSYREAGLMVLHLDKGSAAGVAVGRRGAILEGPAGTEHLAGGMFTITEVVDGKRSIAKSDLKSLGKNSRVIIYVGR